MSAEVVVASWNVHSGIDGWGRPFDVVEGCRSIDADVLVLQETWCADGATSIARLVGDALGYRVEESVIAKGVMFGPSEHATQKWGPPPWQRALHGTRVHGRLEYATRVSERAGRSQSRSAGPDEAGHTRTASRLVRGTIGLAVLSRLELGYVETWDLGQFFRDPTRRSAIAVQVVLNGGGSSVRHSLLVVGTHLSHLRHGSLRQISLLRSMLVRRTGPVVPAVLAGDMNLTGAPLSFLLPGWRRAVRGPTWPAWRPVGQSDHILVTAAVNGSGEVLGIRGSDHLPVRAHLSFS